MKKRKKTLAARARTAKPAAPTIKKQKRAPRQVDDSTRDVSPQVRPAYDMAQLTFAAHTAGFPIVGIGASAGGLEALEQFLVQVPAKCGAAFVVVQHLDPNHKTLLVELLQRTTTLAVLEAGDGTRVERDHVYVIPPGKDMSLLHGTLHLLPQPTGRGRVLPVDFFFRSLAHDQGDGSIAVVLSGMGTDGTLGLRAIKEVAGATFVQTPSTARYDSMPRSAIEAGLADIVAPADELPGRILSYRDHVPHLADSEELPSMDAQATIDEICVVLRELSGNDFSLYKQSTIYRRIERRMGLVQLRSFAEYLRFLREDAHEAELLFNELLIGVTSFFRDPGEWDRLRDDVVSGLVSARASDGVIRAWIAACSTGEEAYSMAILLKEVIGANRSVKPMAIQVFATDLDREAIEKARVGLYPENIAADVSPERLRRWFIREDAGYRVGKEIRECVVFAPQNVIVDPPFTKVDLVSCRNLMIYLATEVQKKLIPLFHYCLNPGGALFLGTAETVGPFSNLFAPLDGRTRVYRRLDQTAIGVQSDLAFGMTRGALRERPEPTAQSRQPAPNLQALVDRVIVQRFAPLGVLCSTKGDVLYVSGRAGKYFGFPAGKANLNVIAMTREGLRVEMAGAFNKALRSERPVTVRDIELGSNGTPHHATLTVQKLTEPKELAGSVLVMVAESAAKTAPAGTKAAGRRSGRSVHMEEDLARAREEVHAVREQMQTSHEELESTNEELQSTNEELQSTNEELTTSKEEMQSLNEELETINHELQSKLDELSRSNNDMKNLLNSTDIATLFLDQDLRVRRFTTATAKIIKLIPADVGRPITDIASDLDYDALEQDAIEVLRTLVVKEKQSVARDGRAFSVRIMPYRTLDNVIDGVVITFTDITETRALEVAAQDQASHLRQLTESLPNLVWGARADGAFEYVSRQWLEYTGVSAGEQLHWGWLDRLHPADRDRVRDEWRAAVRAGTSFDSEFRIRGADGSHRWFKARSVAIHDHTGSIVRWYGTSTEIDALKRAEERVRTLVTAMSDGFIGLDRDNSIRLMNPSAERILGIRAADVAGRSVFDVVPANRGLEHVIAAAPTEGLLTLGEERYTARVERDEETGLWVFLRREHA